MIRSRRRWADGKLTSRSPLERTPGRTEMDSPLLDLNYGLPSLQLKAEFPIKIVHEDSRGTAAGAGDLLLGVKWRFLNNQDS